MPRDFDFNDQLVMSGDGALQDDIRATLLAHFPGAVDAYFSHVKNDKQGVDWWVEIPRHPFHIGIDVKTRDKDFGKDDLALESWSVVEKGIIGWSRDATKITDYILFIWKPSRRWHLVPFRPLCAAFSANWEAWRTQYKWDRQSTTGRGGVYHSECIFTPRKVLWDTMRESSTGLVPAPEEELVEA